MIKPSPDDKVYPVIKLATVVDALAEEGIPAKDVLAGVRLSREEISSPAARISLNQLIECYGNAAGLSRDPCFSYRTGQRFHVSAYGMYGFAILSSMNYRQTMQFAENYHQLATPFAELHFREQNGSGVWTITPMPHSRVNASLYKFLVEIQLGICVSLHRDVMGPLFTAREFHVTYPRSDNAAKHPDIFECPVSYGEPENRFVFDATWLDGTPRLGNEITHATVVELCDRLMDELRLSAGVAGKVRRVLLGNLMRPRSLGDIAGQLYMSERTLRRKLREESTSFRILADQLRTEIAIKYLRDTELTVEAIAELLGFSDAANFRQAFRRWTKATPHAFRDTSGKGTTST
jgi:AraC-like DNA-binding protein